MAKKVRTPEEVQASMEKKAAKRKLFFGTFTKALALFLALAMSYSLATIAFTPSGVSVAGGNATQNSESGDNSDDENLFGDGNESNGGSNNESNNGDSSNNGGSSGDNNTANGNTSNGGSSNGSSSSSSGVSKEEVVKLLNDATKKVVNGSYKWTRKCWYTKEVDVGNATSTLNGIIQKIDPNADVGSVVGNFLGITGKESDPAWENKVTNGKPGENMPEKYMLKAFALTVSDIKGWQPSGNKYSLQLNACKNPQKDGKNALHHVTNDFITLQEVKDGVAGALGSLSGLLTVQSCDVEFTKILVVAEVENGNLKSVQISYSMNVKSLNLKATALPITGKGAGDMICTYSDFS